jgi:enoyl-CoA hydratase/carnithine racemase
MQFTQLHYTAVDGIATITLHRPEKLNAYTHTMAMELVAACDFADADDSVRAVVVTGDGRAFCAGADLDPAAAEFDEAKYDGARFDDGVAKDAGGVASLRFAAMRKPVIAAINGPAVGIGATLILPMDIRIAAESARFGFVFVRRCLVPEAASSWFLPRLVGMSRAMEWVATARVFDAAEALEGGLVSRVCPDGELLATAYAIAGEIADNVAPVAFAAAKQMMWSMLGADNPFDAHWLDSHVLNDLIQSADFAEGVSAFLERRKPKFTLSPTLDLPVSIQRWPAPAGS